MKRDEKGRFSKKEEEGFEIMVSIPPLKKILTWILIIAILIPWISIIRKNNLVQKIMDTLDDFFQKKMKNQ